MNKKKMSLMLAACLAVSPVSTAFGKEAPVNQTQEAAAQNLHFEGKVDEYMNALVKMDRFSGTVLVAQKGKVLVSKGYGYADKEKKIPNTSQTKFLIGSISKQFTSMAIMQLQANKKLSVNDPVSKYIKDFPNGDKITIHHLLTHTSGIGDYSDPAYRYGEGKSVQKISQLLEYIKKQPAVFQPGEKFQYCNANYILLGVIIEKVQKHSYTRYLHKNIFDKLNMENTGYSPNYPSIKNNASKGYLLANETMNELQDYNTVIAWAAGGLYSTAEDLYAWDRALNTDKLLKKGDREKMFTSDKDGYAYGWMVQDQPKIQFHGGAIEGYQNMIMRFPNEDTTIIVLNNYGQSNVTGISNDLAKMLFGAPYEVPQELKEITLKPELLDQYTGTFEFLPGINVEITKEADMLYLQATGEGKVKLRPASEDTFFVYGTDLVAGFKELKDGKYHVLNVRGQDIKRIK